MRPLAWRAGPCIPVAAQAHGVDVAAETKLADAPVLVVIPDHDLRNRTQQSVNARTRPPGGAAAHPVGWKQGVGPAANQGQEVAAEEHLHDADSAAGKICAGEPAHCRRGTGQHGPRAGPRRRHGLPTGHAPRSCGPAPRLKVSRKGCVVKMRKPDSVPHAKHSAVPAVAVSGARPTWRGKESAPCRHARTVVLIEPRKEELSRGIGAQAHRHRAGKLVKCASCICPMAAPPGHHGCLGRGRGSASALQWGARRRAGPPRHRNSAARLQAHAAGVGPEAPCAPTARRHLYLHGAALRFPRRPLARSAYPGARDMRTFSAASAASSRSCASHVPRRLSA